jgi:CheY-specific phosphatase CheX
MAEQSVHRFCGMEIPFDSEDMSDAVGELTNIFVGQVKAALDQRGVDVEISLPSVLRAQQLQVVAHSKGKKLSQAYNTECGPMWTGIIVGQS